MSRQARLKTESGFYHTMIRGVNRQIIFEESSDYSHFLDLTKRFKEDCGIDVLAYCLMDNHAHFVLKDNTNTLSLFLKNSILYMRCITTKNTITPDIFFRGASDLK